MSTVRDRIGRTFDTSPSTKSTHELAQDNRAEGRRAVDIATTENIKYATAASATSGAVLKSVCVCLSPKLQNHAFDRHSHTP